MAGSKSSHTARNCAIAFLSLWSIISLITIIVWATSPDLKGASECNANLKRVKEKYAEEKNIWTKDRHALEELVRRGRFNQSLLLNHTDLLQEQLQQLNETLNSCFQHNNMLYDNITVLNEEIELHKAIEANLTSNITLQQDMIELLQYNLSQTNTNLESCKILEKAAQSLQTVAEKQTQGCHSSKQFLQKQLDKCKVMSKTSPDNDGPTGPRSGIFLVGLLSMSILLLP